MPAWSQQICHLLSEHEVFKKAKRIGLFFPREWEVGLLPLWHLRPKHCGFPKTLSKTWEMEFYEVESLKKADLNKGVGGIFEPQEVESKKMTQFTSEDLILVPGLAFDRNGGRVGSGKGVYDRFLSGKGKEAVKWGVAFSPQVVEQPVFLESHDIKLNGLVTEKGFIYF